MTRSIIAASTSIATALYATIVMAQTVIKVDPITCVKRGGHPVESIQNGKVVYTCILN